MFARQVEKSSVTQEEAIAFVALRSGVPAAAAKVLNLPSSSSVTLWPARRQRRHRSVSVKCHVQRIKEADPRHEAQRS